MTLAMAYTFKCLTPALGYNLTLQWVKREFQRQTEDTQVVVIPDRRLSVS